MDLGVRWISGVRGACWRSSPWERCRPLAGRCDKMSCYWYHPRSAWNRTLWYLDGRFFLEVSYCCILALILKSNSGQSHAKEWWEVRLQDMTTNQLDTVTETRWPLQPLRYTPKKWKTSENMTKQFVILEVWIIFWCLGQVYLKMIETHQHSNVLICFKIEI